MKIVRWLHAKFPSLHRWYYDPRQGMKGFRYVRCRCGATGWEPNP